MRVPFEKLKAEFKRVLLSIGVSAYKAEQCAAIFAANSRDGVYTHGLNRFPSFVQTIKEGLFKPDVEPVMENSLGAIEQWNGNFGLGMLNATACMARAIGLAEVNGIGCVAIKYTNHWMRGGTYGLQAADAGYIGICFTNTIANLPPWGGLDPRLGNNPLVIAVPRQEGHVLLDMAISQYSVGKLMESRAQGKELLIPGGYDTAGNLSTDAEAVLTSRRMLPIGFWKGSGLSLMLDLLATLLSGGKPTMQISEHEKEWGVSQVFICLKTDAQQNEQMINQILDYTKSSRTLEGGGVSYPGENMLKTRLRNLKEGIPVDENIWAQVLGM
ncbi:3-dehydro-L-gulonate 2-dehydrogenase [Mucilaginibacter celer]|uniref:3-dehydro-L-gulonate 2-dehydrogenase n=2 Tax=Mucilaginibacter celer TaxID=2305508 RepID=A0A494W1L9_9SPHI|nr:3-dehydro-L-gulonate 2-dehydrogenase [Mucilaginibacter celer]